MRKHCCNRESAMVHEMEKNKNLFIRCSTCQGRGCKCNGVQTEKTEGSLIPAGKAIHSRRHYEENTTAFWTKNKHLAYAIERPCDQSFSAHGRTTTSTSAVGNQ